MGKISKVFYEEVPSDVCTVTEAAAYYYHFNLLSSHEMFHEDYEKYELSQAAVKSNVLGSIVANNNERAKVSSSLLAISSLKNKVVVIADVVQ